MNKLPVLAVIALTLLAGCSALSPGEATFHTEAKAPHTSMVNTTHTADLVVENVGSKSDTFTATLAVNGTEVDMAEATIDAGGTKTLTFTHTFEETGEYTITIADEEYSVVVVDPQKALDAHDSVSSYTMSESLHIETNSSSEMGETYSMNTQYRYNLTEKALSLILNYESADAQRTIEGWYVDGIGYQKDGTTNPEYSTFESDWNDLSRPPGPADYLHAISANASVTYGGGATTYLATLDNETTVSNIRTLLADEHTAIPSSIANDPRNVTDFRAEVIVDGTHVSSVDISFTIASSESNTAQTQHFDLTITYDNYNDNISTTVPADVRENTKTGESSSTNTDDSATTEPGARQTTDHTNSNNQ